MVIINMIILSVIILNMMKLNISIITMEPLNMFYLRDKTHQCLHTNKLGHLPLLMSTVHKNHFVCVLYS